MSALNGWINHCCDHAHCHWVAVLSETEHPIKTCSYFRCPSAHIHRSALLVGLAGSVMKPDVKPCKFWDETAKFMNYSTQFWYAGTTQIASFTMEHSRWLLPDAINCSELGKLWARRHRQESLGLSRHDLNWIFVVYRNGLKKTFYQINSLNYSYFQVITWLTSVIQTGLLF